MYCVGKIGRMYVRSAVEEIRDTKGRLVRERSPEIWVQFQHGGVIPEYAKEKARQYLNFPGLPENADPLSYVTWFDSQIAAAENNWDEEDIRQVEEFLRSRDGHDFIIVEQEAVPAPYANYPKHRKVQGRRTVDHAIQDITAVYEAAGFDVGQAIQYEQQNHDKDTAVVVAALEALVSSIPEEPDPEPLMAA